MVQFRGHALLARFEQQENIVEEWIEELDKWVAFDAGNGCMIWLVDVVVNVHPSLESLDIELRGQPDCLWNELILDKDLFEFVQSLASKGYEINGPDLSPSPVDNVDAIWEAATVPPVAEEECRIYSW